MIIFNSPSLIDWLINWLVNWLIHSFTHSFMCSFPECGPHTSTGGTMMYRAGVPLASPRPWLREDRLVSAPKCWECYREDGTWQAKGQRRCLRRRPVTGDVWRDWAGQLALPWSGPCFISGFSSHKAPNRHRRPSILKTGSLLRWWGSLCLRALILTSFLAYSAFSICNIWTSCSSSRLNSMPPPCSLPGLLTLDLIAPPLPSVDPPI